jgi:hypothetical protein
MVKNLRDKSVVAGDGEGKPHELPVRLLLLLVRIVGDLQAGRIICSSRHPAHPPIRRVLGQ